jgi:hypothetical protein
VVAGNFFPCLPSGADAYILKSIIHDWDDAESIAILRYVSKGIAPEGKLLLIEMVVPDQVSQSHGGPRVTGSGLNMLVNTGGRERSGAGFRLVRVIPTSTPWSIVEGIRLSANGNC